MNCNWIYIINTVGLIADFAGFVIIFNNGTPSFKDSKGVRRYLVAGGNKEDRDKQEKQVKRANIGAYFIIYGFLIQLGCSVYQIFK